MLKHPKVFDQKHLNQPKIAKYASELKPDAVQLSRMTSLNEFDRKVLEQANWPAIFGYFLLFYGLDIRTL